MMVKNSEDILEDMNAVQVRKSVNKKTVAILVFGACENHGDHMPFGSDFIVPIELAKRVARKSHNVIGTACYAVWN